MNQGVERRRGYTRVSPQNQVTLPVETLRAAGLRPGDEFSVSVDGRGRVVLTAAADPIERLIGSAPGLSADVDLQRMRDEWRR